MGSREWVERSPDKMRWGPRKIRLGGNGGYVAKEEILSLKVWVDDTKRRVVFAEASSDFIDILFSVMTLSLGTIVKLLSKNFGLGSTENFYDSIEKLDLQHWQTMACKNMVLRHRNVALEPCEDLKFNVDGAAKPNQVYIRQMKSSIPSSQCYYNYARDKIFYDCDEVMDKVGLLDKIIAIEYDGVFVKNNNTKYIITDDLHVKPCSLLHYHDILKEFGVGGIHLMKKTLVFGREELFNLLKNLLEEKEALTKICFPDSCIRSTTPIYNDEMEINFFEREDNAQVETNTLQIKLIMNRTNNNVVCAELGEELANQLFSFLTFSLGTVLGLIGYSKSLGCMNNLYNSIQELSINCFKSEEAKSMLISPQLPPFFDYYKQMINTHDRFSDILDSKNSCQECLLDNINTCEHGVEESILSEIDPKLPMTNIYPNEGFVRTPNFLITDDCHITPMTFLDFTQIIQTLGLHVDQLEKKEMSIGKAQVVDILRAMLVSKTVFSDALFHCAK